MPPIDPENQSTHSPPSRLFRDDTRFALGRIAVFQYLAVVVFIFLIGGFWVLQIRDGDFNSELAERNLYAAKRNGKDRVYLDGAPLTNTLISVAQA